MHKKITLESKLNILLSRVIFILHFPRNNRNTINCTIIAPKNKKALGFLREPIAIVGGGGGIRTHARGKPSNDLATHAAQLHNPQMLFYFHIFNWFRYIVNKFHILHIFIEDKPYNTDG